MEPDMIESVSTLPGSVISTNRACETCSRAKAKCTPQPDNRDDRCARCFRLKKECTTAPRRPRKRRSPNHPTSLELQIRCSRCSVKSRLITRNVAHLEEKIESLVSLLGAHVGASKPDRPAQPSGESSLRTENTLGTLSSLEVAYDGTPLMLGCRETYRGSQSWVQETVLNKNYPPSIQEPFHHIAGPQQYPRTPSLTNNSTPLLIAQDAQIRIQPGEEADRCLKTYRDKFEPHFPFIVILPGADSESLFRQRPWVYRAIMVVGNELHRTQQIEMSQSLSLDVMKALVLRGEKSLDMLQGVLVHNIWSFCYSAFTPHSQSIAMYQLAQAMVFDLGLNKPIPYQDPSGILPEQPRGFTPPEPPRFLSENNPKEARRSPEDRRTFLTCYLSTSLLSLHIRKTEFMQHTSYLDYCCKVLSESREYESDVVLVAMVRLQCIAESFQRTLAHKHEGSSDESKAPAGMYIKGMQAELQNFWLSLSPGLQSNSLLLMILHSAEIFLYEPSIQKPSSPTTFGFSSSQRLDMLYACLMASQALLNLCLSQPTSAFGSFSMLQLASTGVGLSTLFKLSVIEEVGWDLADVRKTVNLSDYFTQFIAKFEKAGHAIDESQIEPCGTSFPTRCSNAMRRALGFYEARTCATSKVAPPQDQTVPTSVDSVPNGEQPNWIDDAYWQDLIGDMDFLQH